MDGTSKYINAAFARVNLEQIRSFILTGLEDKQELLDEQYNARLEKASEPIYNRLSSLYPSANELTEPANELSHALSTFQDVYMEIGMKAGAKLLYQLIVEDAMRSVGV